MRSEIWKFDHSAKFTSAFGTHTVLWPGLIFSARNIQLCFDAGKTAIHITHF